MVVESSPSLDANCLLRWLLKDIPEQAEAVERLLGGDRNLNVADLAITEVAYVLEKVYGLPRRIVVSNIETVMSTENIVCNRELFQTILPIYAKHKAVSFNDCCLAVQAELSDAKPLYTFDKSLASRLRPAKLLK